MYRGIACSREYRIKQRREISGMKGVAQTYATLALAVLLIVLLVADAEARGRTGSYRVGGYNSHGKGSHYVGGR
jgi:hypothetical protein